jgi:hypothetical protein
VTFPEAPFELRNWTTLGYHCILDRKPDRTLDLQVDKEFSPLARNPSAIKHNEVIDMQVLKFVVPPYLCLRI